MPYSAIWCISSVRICSSTRWWRGPTIVVTDLGIYRFDDSGEMRLESLHPGATVESMRETIGWDIKVAPDLATTPPPTAEELRLVREELDPGGVYTK